MANVMFRKGSLKQLPKSYTEGTFYVTTDEKAIYLDTTNDANGRIRLGDFQEFATITALEANENPSTTALYYVKDINCLAKWDGSQYIQINRDTGMIDVEVIGAGNAVTDAEYKAGTRKLTLTKGATYATGSQLSALSTRVGELELAGGEKNKLEKVKVNGTALTIDSEKAVDIKIEESANNGKIKVNNVDVAIHGLGSAAFVETTTFDAKGDAAKEAGKVQSALDTYQTEANAAIQAAATKGQKGIDDAAAALTAAQQASAKAESEAAAALTAAKTDAATKYATKTALAEVDGKVIEHEGRLSAVETFFVTAEGESLNTALDTLVEIQKYITEDGTAAGEMLEAIKKVEEDIEKEATARATGDTTLNSAIEALAGVVNGKVAQGDFNTLKGRVETAETDITGLKTRIGTTESDIAGLKTSKADASVVTTLSTNFTNYKAEHASDYTNAQIDSKVTNAINALDFDIKADSGYALTEILITDGQFISKKQAKFATENYVAEQVAAAALVWGDFN